MQQVTSPANNRKDNNIDREVEFLLKEYEAMRNETLTREASRAQIGSVTIILFGGITASVPFLLLQGSHGLQLSIPLPYAILMLLVVSLLFTSLQWAILDPKSWTQLDANIINLRLTGQLAESAIAVQTQQE